MRRLFVKRTPQWIQSLQPTEQWRIRHRRKRPRQVLIQVVMRIHQAWRYETIRCVNNLLCGWRHSATNRRNKAISNRDPAIANFSSIVIHRRYKRRVRDYEISEF